MTNVNVLDFSGKAARVKLMFAFGAISAWAMDASHWCFSCQNVGVEFNLQMIFSPKLLNYVLTKLAVLVVPRPFRNTRISKFSATNNKSINIQMKRPKQICVARSIMLRFVCGYSCSNQVVGINIACVDILR